MIRISAISVAALIVASSTAAFAADPMGMASGSMISGDFSVFAGAEAMTGYYDEVFGIIGGDARISIPMSNGFSMQVDLSGQASPNALSNYNDTYDFAGHFGGHLLYRDPNQYQLGVFAGLSTSSVDGGEGWLGNTFGAEAQLYMDDFTLWGQLGVVNQNEGGSEPIHMGAARGGIRYFVNDNLRLDFDANYAAGDFDGYHASIAGVGAGLEYLTDWNGVPVSYFARYDGTYYDFNDYSSGSELTNHTFKVGLSFKLDTGSLKNQDRNGPNTDLNFSKFSVLDATY